MAAWQGWYCVAIMFIMFVALLKNIAGPDILMLGSLAMMLAADAVDIPEGLKGFSNKGLLTVACLFVVAAGISNTGALDYYMGKLLGTPKSPASAQIRLMVPVAIVSAFLNNTPVVAIMIPILQKWYARKIRAFREERLDRHPTAPARVSSRPERPDQGGEFGIRHGLGASLGQGPLDDAVQELHDGADPRGGDLERAGVRVLARALVSDDEGEYFFAALPAPHLAHGELAEHVAVRGGDDAEAIL